MNKILQVITKNKKVIWASALVPALILAGFTAADDPVGKRIKRMVPEEAAKMAKAIEALVTPELAEGLTLRLWGVDSLVADPIAIHMDDKGPFVLYPHQPPEKFGV